jgi:hypothetical protein
MDGDGEATTCEHEFPPPAYEGIDANPAETNHLLCPDDLGVEDGVWTCPHDAVEGETFCVFHLDPGDRPSNLDVTTASVRQVEAATELPDRADRRRHRQFVDAQFDVFSPRETAVGGTEHGYIDCRHARFDAVDCERAEFDQRIRLVNATFGTADGDELPEFRRAVFRYSAGLSRVTFEQPVSFRGAHFHDWAGSRLPRFRADADFEWATFHDMASMRGSRFDAGVSFRAVEFHGWAQLLDAEFGGPSGYELAEETAAFVGGLHERGIESGETLLLYLPNRPQYLVAALGAFRAGVAVSPVNPQYKRRELGYQLEDTDASVVATHPELRPVVTETLAETERDPTVVSVGDPDQHHQDDVAFDTVRGDPVTVDCDPDDVALLPYTSGTTGKPKGVRLTHRNFVAQLVSHLFSRRESRRLRRG